MLRRVGTLDLIFSSFILRSIRERIRLDTGGEGEEEERRRRRRDPGDLVDSGDLSGPGADCRPALSSVGTRDDSQWQTAAGHQRDEKGEGEEEEEEAEATGVATDGRNPA